MSHTRAAALDLISPKRAVLLSLYTMCCGRWASDMGAQVRGAWLGAWLGVWLGPESPQSHGTLSFTAALKMSHVSQELA